ncbi:hypothetical protein [Agathobaculum sp.]|uniref:hypothetical protein n=1 Tax=Agathobaculum sp. TaxID=2048138 RepID=UPI002A83F1E6|nr:hypothetical protein [Agathobaculum sp.]MDY3619331.1 hypothetical protein [Agathobaculum sp.]
MDRKDETMNLDALKDLLSDVPDGGEFDLDSIIAEVEGLGTAEPKRPAAAMPEAPAAAPRPAEPARPAPQPVAPRQTAPRQAPRRAPEPAEDELPDLSAFEEEEIDPREERRAARAAKAAQKADRETARQARRAEKQAARMAEDDEDEAYGEEPPARAPRARAERMSKKEARAARLAAELDEEEDDIELRDPMQAQRALQRRAQGLNARSIIVLILAVLAAYLSLAPQFEALPLPIVLDAGQNPAIAIGALMLLQFIALFVGVDVFGLGFVSLFQGTPDRSTLVSVAILASLLHGASIIVFDNQAGVEIPYLAVSILMLYASMREERGRFAARARAYKAFSSAEQPMAVYSHYDREDDVCRALKGPLHQREDFLREMERPDTVDRFSMIYVPIALAASIIFALVASVGRGEPVRFFWAFSALLSVSAPLGLLCAFGASYKNVSRRLLGSGAALAGARQASLLRGTEEVVLSENDLFPAGSVSLEALQNMGRLGDDQILAYAAALTSAAGLEVGRVLSETLRERYGTAAQARNLQIVEGGVAGEIGGSRAVLGTAALMVQMGVRMRAGQDAGKCYAYLVVDNALAGVLTLRYQPTKHTYQAMRLMRRMHMSASLAVRDFNISPAMVESEFDLRRGFADQPDYDAVTLMLDPAYTQGDAPAAILTREGAGPFVQVLRCADKLAGAVRSCLTLGAFAGICGLLIVFYLVFQNAVTALPVMHLLLYLLLWYLPAFIITQQTH